MQPPNNKNNKFIKYKNLSVKVKNNRSKERKMNNLNIIGDGNQKRNSRYDLF